MMAGIPSAAMTLMRFMLMMVAIALAGCGGGGSSAPSTVSTPTKDVTPDGDSSTNDSAAPADTLATEITVTRDQCTPFGNPPRPRIDLLNVTNPLVCSGGGKRLPDWIDPQGTRRSACIYQPEDHTAKSAPLPLVFWLQGSAVPAELQLDLTQLIPAVEKADLTGDPERQGFVLIELAGRVTNHFYPIPNSTGTSGWDVWDRQLAPGGKPHRTVNGETFPLNLDAAAIDHYIDQALASGKIDPDRIYMMGWSNGAAMAINYAMNRPGVAAAAVYSAPNPYDALSDPCGQIPVPGAPRNDTELQIFNPGAPIYHIINKCDIYSICPTGTALQDTLRATGAAELQLQIIDELQQPVSQCMALCGTNPRGTDYTDPTSGIPAVVGAYGTLLHLRWPTKWNEEMFTFLRDNPLP